MATGVAGSSACLPEISVAPSGLSLPETSSAPSAALREDRAAAAGVCGAAPPSKSSEVSGGADGPAAASSAAAEGTSDAQKCRAQSWRAGALPGGTEKLSRWVAGKESTTKGSATERLSQNTRRKGKPKRKFIGTAQCAHPCLAAMVLRVMCDACSNAMQSNAMQPHPSKAATVAATQRSVRSSRAANGRSTANAVARRPPPGRPPGRAPDGLSNGASEGNSEALWEGVPDGNSAAKESKEASKGAKAAPEGAAGEKTHKGRRRVSPIHLCVNGKFLECGWARVQRAAPA